MKRPYRFPWREGNHFELLIDGDAFFPAMLEAIAGATSYVLLEMYLVESGATAARFIDALTAAAARGVDVKVLLDGFGARGLARADVERLRAASCAVAWYNPLRFGQWWRMVNRDHRKLLLVDGEVGYVGGAGLADAFDPAAVGGRSWRETMVRIRGPVLADWQLLFAETWQRCGPACAGLVAIVPRYFGPGGAGCVTCSHGPALQDSQRMLLRHMGAARERLWLSTAYFVPTRKIRRALRRAARRGVDVRLLLASPHTDHPAVRHAGRRFYDRLLRQGVRIFEYQGRVLHAKAVVCDGWTSIGSSNFDHWTLRWNLEANQSVLDGEFAREVTAMFERDFAYSREQTAAEWLRRDWRTRWRESWWGAVDAWLHRLGRH